MPRLKFTKMVGSGNDFILIAGKPSGNLSRLAKLLCDRKFGIGADGLLLLDKCKNADLSMRIFNADGSEAQMCGNGARCVAFFSGKAKSRIRTSAGMINTQVYGAQVKIQITDPKDIKLDLPIVISKRTLRVNFINTGVPHAVIFVEGLDKIDVKSLGCQIRYHKKFSPAGTNVNFVEMVNKNSIKVRTYERGVEDETLACGTGSVAASLISSFMLQAPGTKMLNVHTRGNETLKVYFKESKDRFADVWLEGKAKIVYKGEYYV